MPPLCLPPPVQVPEALQLEGYKVKQIVKELVATRRRLLLVQVGRGGVRTAGGRRANGVMKKVVACQLAVYTANAFV